MPVASDYSESPTAKEARRKRSCWGRLWYSFATQQIAGHPTIFNLLFSVGIFFLLSVAFLVGGGWLLTVSLRQVQIKATYSAVDKLAPLTNEQRSTVLQGGNVTDPETGALVRLPLTSKLEVEVMEDMAGPVHMYYVLTDYFQNYIRYVGAVSYNQLHGDRNASTTNCVAQKRLDVPDRSKLPNNGGINPCGLAAWAYFNDTFDNFEILRAGETDVFEEVALDDSDLVWETDRTFFGNYASVNHNTLPPLQGGQHLTLNVSQDEHFMEWMRPAAHPTVRKYYGLINDDLKQGDKLLFDVGHRYNVYGFGGEKQLLFTTEGPFGNRNLTFGLAWLVMGVLCGIITVTYLVVGWKQLWSTEERTLFLKERWERGDLAGPSRRNAPVGT